MTYEALIRVWETIAVRMPTPIYDVAQALHLD